MGNQEGVDFILCEKFLTGALAHVDELGGRRNHGQNSIADERVVQDNVGDGEQSRRLQGEQLGIARSRPNKINLAPHATHSPRPNFKEYVSVSPQSRKRSAVAGVTSAQGLSRSLMVLSGVRDTQAVNDSASWRSA